MSQYYSPKEVARALGASESSLKRWVDKGLIHAVRTAGGHRRLELGAVVDFVRRSGRRLENPNAIDLPLGKLVHSAQTAAESQRILQAALVEGNEAQATSVVLDLYISGWSVSEIGDKLISPAFQDIGSLWKCGDVQIYEERRACELCHRALFELGRVIGQGKDPSKTAIGGTPDEDPYTLATGLVDLVLRENGWKSESLGSMLPLETIRQAIMDRKPRLCWLSASSIAEPERFCSEMNILSDAARSVNTSLVVGGRAITSDIVSRLDYPQFFDGLAKMEGFLQQADRERPVEHI